MQLEAGGADGGEAILATSTWALRSAARAMTRRATAGRAAPMVAGSDVDRILQGSGIAWTSGIGREGAPADDLLTADRDQDRQLVGARRTRIEGPPGFGQVFRSSMVQSECTT